MDVSLNVVGVNSDLLDQQLRAAVPASYMGCSVGPSNDPTLRVYVVVHLQDSASSADQSTAIATVQAHNPAQQTAAQVAAAQVASTTATLKGKLATEAAYFAAVPAADLSNGVALARACVDLAALFVALSTRLG